ncbi:Syntaxin-12 [Ranunculus cassubicifolius]
MADSMKKKQVFVKKPYNKADSMKKQVDMGDSMNKQPQNSKQKVVDGVFPITTALSRFRREINNLGSHTDTLEFREKLHMSRLHIVEFINDASAELINDASAELKQGFATDDDFSIELVKRAKDLIKLCTEFLKVNNLAFEREKAYEPRVQVSAHNEPLPLSTSDNGALLEPLLSNSSGEILKQQHQQQEKVLLLLQNEVVYNELLIEERAQEIKVIQEQVEEVSHIFKDLGKLVQNQGAVIIDIESIIESSQKTTAHGTQVLEDPRTRQKSDSSLNCLYMVVLGLVLFILVIVVVT